MGIDRDMFSQLQRMMRPLAMRIVNMIARGVVQLANDSTRLQLLQLGVLAGETVDSAEHFQPYGFSSIPLPGAEAVVAFPNGDRSHPLVLAAADRRYRPTGGQGGEVTLYNNANARVILKANGTIEIRSSGGTAVALATKADIDALKTWASTHIHTSGGPGNPTTAPTAPPPSAAGTSKLKGE